MKYNNLRLEVRKMPEIWYDDETHSYMAGQRGEQGNQWIFRQDIENEEADEGQAQLQRFQQLLVAEDREGARQCFMGQDADADQEIMDVFNQIMFDTPGEDLLFTPGAAGDGGGGAQGAAEGEAGEVFEMGEEESIGEALVEAGEWLEPLVLAL